MFDHLDEHTRPEPERAALLTIDLQNDFCLPGAPAEGAGALHAAHTAAQLAQYYRDHGLPIYHVIRLYPPEAQAIDACRRNSVMGGNRLLHPDDSGCHPVNGLLPKGAVLDTATLLTGSPQRLSTNETIFYKPRWGCFHGTALHEELHNRGINTLIITGTWFSNCVRTTVYEATARDYRVVLIKDAVAGMYDRGEADLVRIGCAICTANEWMALETQRLQPESQTD